MVDRSGGISYTTAYPMGINRGVAVLTAEAEDALEDSKSRFGTSGTALITKNDSGVRNPTGWVEAKRDGTKLTIGGMDSVSRNQTLRLVFGTSFEVFDDNVNWRLRPLDGSKD